MKKILLPLLITSSLLSFGCSAKHTNSVDPGSDSADINISSEEIIGHGINAKKLSSGLDANGHRYITFSYTISPNDAFYHAVTASITFADSRVAASYLTAAVDSENKTVTVTCLQAFDSVATLRLSAAFGNAYCDIQIDYKVKMLDCSVNSVDTFYKYASDISTRDAPPYQYYGVDANFNLYSILKGCFNVTYSVGTIPYVAPQSFESTQTKTVSGTSYYVIPQSDITIYGGDWASTAYKQHCLQYMYEAFGALDLNGTETTIGGELYSLPSGSGNIYSRYSKSSIYAAINNKFVDMDSYEKAAFKTCFDNGYINVKIDTTHLTHQIIDGSHRMGFGSNKQYIYIHIQALSMWL